MRLLTLAVIDDLVALLVIATVYTEHVDVVALAISGGLLRTAATRCATSPVEWRMPPAVFRALARGWRSTSRASTR